MMLRSSSTPVLGSLLASFSDSPNGNGNGQHLSELHGCTQRHMSGSKISCTNGGSQSLGRPLFHSPAVGEPGYRAGFRRVQSEGNLGELAEAVDKFSLAKKPARKGNNCCSLEAIPSFSSHQMGTPFDSDNEGGSEEEGQEIEDVDDPFKVENLVLKQGGGDGRMYLATGLGVSGMSLAGIDGNGGGGGGGSYRPVAYDREGDDGGRLMMEDHYSRMLEGDPGNPMVLRNYAQFLYQVKGDLDRAEEYYSRAILADPKDGEILSQYAKLIWELHHDDKRAEYYFERAIQASGEDSHVHAAYASFLWDAEEDEDDAQGSAAGSTVGVQPLLHHGFVASATA